MERQTTLQTKQSMVLSINFKMPELQHLKSRSKDIWKYFYLYFWLREAEEKLDGDQGS